MTRRRDEEPLEQTGAYRVRMAGVTYHVPADNYEQAVARLEAWCAETGVERRGASFVALYIEERCPGCAEGTVHVAQALRPVEEAARADA